MKSINWSVMEVIGRNINILGPNKKNPAIRIPRIKCPQQLYICHQRGASSTPSHRTTLIDWLAQRLWQKHGHWGTTLLIQYTLEPLCLATAYHVIRTVMPSLQSSLWVCLGRKLSLMNSSGTADDSVSLRLRPIRKLSHPNPIFQFYRLAFSPYPEPRKLIWR